VLVMTSATPVPIEAVGLVAGIVVRESVRPRLPDFE
jgi:hypothetical protein